MIFARDVHGLSDFLVILSDAYKHLNSSCSNFG